MKGCVKKKKYSLESVDDYYYVKAVGFSQGYLFIYFLNVIVTFRSIFRVQGDWFYPGIQRFEDVQVPYIQLCSICM